MRVELANEEKLCDLDGGDNLVWLFKYMELAQHAPDRLS